MKIASLLSFFSLALVVGGCAANAANSDDNSDQSNDAISAAASLAPGTFKLYDQPNHVSSGCDIMSTLTLTKTGPKATLSDSVEGSTTGGFSCHLAVPADTRSYILTLSGTDCGSKIFVGHTFLPFGGSNSIKITDNRTRTCEDNPAADLVVEETKSGSTTKTLYSAPVAITFEGTLVHTVGPGGENTGRTIEAGSTHFELVLSTAQDASFVDGQLARVTGTETLLSGVETHNRPAIKVDTILVCPTPGSSFNCMPSSSGPALSECLPDNRSWIESKCQGVGYVD